MADIAVEPIKQVEISFEPWVWPFARERRSEIDRHFDVRRRERPGLWNGRILMINEYSVANGLLRGKCFETDYASFLAWRDWDCPDRTVCNYFAAGALRGSDDGYLLGEMAPHTAAAGYIYFPCGTPEPADLIGGTADLTGSIVRELKEETGLDVVEFDAAPEWTMVADGCYRAFIKRLSAREPSDALRARALRHLAAEPQPELSAIHIVRGPADFNARMPGYVTAFLTDAWRNQQ